MMRAIHETRNTRCANICARNDSVVPLHQPFVLADSRSTADIPCWLSNLLSTLDEEHPLRGLLSGQDTPLVSVYQEDETTQFDYLESGGRDIQEGHTIFAYSPRHFSNPSVHRIGVYRSETGTSDPPPTDSWMHNSEQTRPYDWLSSMPTSFLDYQHHSLGVANPDEPILPTVSESSDEYKCFYGEVPPFSTPGPTYPWSFQDIVNETFPVDDHPIYPQMWYVLCNCEDSQVC